ncbi:Uncharacterized protein BM_BM145 [Brugia malayi]|uniref:Phospholipid scramblase n=1 Tax=Brugia malayi TaxID=6279 RepID=A0A4E9F976_BRUMA|nr:Uncharacterized protein BM_BM145 [Brugia malayi]VIO92664.1 Uncharacterized protein BM_BM145 [Brugia malayi]
MSKMTVVRDNERQDKKGNHKIGNNSGNDTDILENDESNSKSEYFAAISPTTITKQPYPQMNFSKNTKISNSINNQTITNIKNEEEKKRKNIDNKLSVDRLSMNDYKMLLRLKPLKQFYIRRHSNTIDTFLDFLQENRYVVQDIEGELIYHVFETSNNTCQCDCKTTRYLQLHFTTSVGQEVIKMEKLLTCSNFFGGQCGIYPTCCIFSTNKSFQITIESPPGHPIEVIGAVVQQISLIRPYYQVKDARGNPKYFIIGSTSSFSCFACRCCDIQYEVISANKNILIGIITKEWAKTSDKITTVDNFNISFPRNITARDKMLLLGALFLVSNFK